MKKLLFVVLVMFFFVAPLFAETYTIDLDSDGNMEVITAEQRFDKLEDGSSFAIEGIIKVTDSQGKEVGSFSMPDHLDKIEFVNFNKDKIKQVVVWSTGGAHYTNIAIYGYSNGRLNNIFEKGSGCAILANFNAYPPSIKVGIPNFDKEGWSYADEPLWEVYLWDGKGFVRDEKSSSTAKINEEIHIVKRVIDGDTLELSNGETIHLIGIDIPKVDTKSAEAKGFVKRLVEGKEVKLEFDVRKKDKSGWLLAYVFVPVYSYSHISRDGNGNLPDFNSWDVADSFSSDPDGAMGVLPEMLNAYIIRNGYATPMTIPPNVKYTELFEKFYQEAREKKRGLWK